MQITSATYRRFIIFIPLLIVIAGFVYIVGKHKTSPPPQESLSESITVITSYAAESASTSHIDTNSEQHAAQSQSSANDKLNEARDAWHLGDITTAPDLPLPQGIDIYETVNLDMESPDYPQVGERLRMTLPGGQTYIARVGSGHLSSRGDYSWRGHLDGYGDDYPVVMTYGQQSIFATITTPQGSYTLESINGKGWLYKNPAPEELTLPGMTDHLEIPGHTPHDHHHH